MHAVALALSAHSRPATGTPEGGHYDGGRPPEGGHYVHPPEGGLHGAGCKIAPAKGGMAGPAKQDGDLTSMLQAWSRGDEDALAALAPLVHRELREMARRLLLKERADMGWQPTDLLQEAYVRLLDWRVVRW